MVLGVKLANLLPLCALALAAPLAACANGLTPEAEKVEDSGHRLELERDECVLTLREGEATESSLELKMEPPCFFSRSEGEVQAYAFDSVGVDSVLIVIGTPVTEYHIDKWALTDEEAHSCGSQHQGVIISDDAVKLSQRVSSGGLVCQNYGVDKKNFWTYAHEGQ